MKKQEVVTNVTTILRDVCHMSLIEDVVVLPTSKAESSGGEISIKYDKGKTTIILSSPKRDVLLTVCKTVISMKGTDISFIASPSLQGTIRSIKAHIDQ